MKKYIFICWVFCLLACAESRQAAVGKYSIREISTEVGDQYADIVRDLKALYAQEESANVPDSVFKGSVMAFIGEIEKYHLSTLPYYRFDNAKFYEDPSIENLQKCMIPLEKLNMIAERDGDVEWRLVVQKEDSIWMMRRGTYQYGKVISWLQDSLYHAGTKDFKIFVHGSTREFVTYEKDGEPLYFRITGEPVSAAHLCEYFVEQYKIGKENKKYIDEHPEWFGNPVRGEK